MTCKHLRKLDRALRGEGLKPALDSACWGALAKRQLCFDAALDRAALTRRGLIPATLKYRERLRRDRGRTEGPFL